MRLSVWLTISVLGFAMACSDDTTGGTGDPNNGTENNQTINNQTANNQTANNEATNNTTANNTATNNSTLPFERNEEGQVLCGDIPCACSDGIDNDGDGLIDGFDPECTGPYDNDEGSFATGIPGDNKDPIWQDCFFDGNSGSGDDGCRYKTGCLTGDLPQDHPDCVVSQRCIEFCRPYAPNGCDCFGCCEVYPPGESTPVFVVIGTTCSIDDLDNPALCQTCVQSDLCVNTCGECELCGGKTVADLPETCFTTPNNTNPDPNNTNPDPVYTCDDGEQVCSDTIPCANTNEYCSQGCCIRVFL